MKNLILLVLKATVKLFCILMAPVARVFSVVYKVVVGILSYGFIGLSLLCLLAIAAELFYYGITKEGIAYLVLSGISFLVRWLLIQSVGLIEVTSDTINMIAHSSTHNSYDYTAEIETFN